MDEDRDIRQKVVIAWQEACYTPTCRKNQEKASYIQADA
jgi:hypothetical protein